MSTVRHSDDIVFTELNPSEDYKSSVLAGLRPELIIEIAGRALSFWVYQTTQEACFQEMIYRNLDEKYTQLEHQVQTVVREANHEIQSLRDRLNGLTKEQEMEKRRNHELSEQYAEKGRQFQKLQLMYDKLKRRTLLAQQGNPPSAGQGPVQPAQPPFAPGFAPQQVRIPLMLISGHFPEQDHIQAPVAAHLPNGPPRAHFQQQVPLDQPGPQPPNPMVRRTFGSNFAGNQVGGGQHAGGGGHNNMNLMPASNNMRVGGVAGFNNGARMTGVGMQSPVMGRPRTPMLGGQFAQFGGSVQGQGHGTPRSRMINGNLVSGVGHLHQAR
ncbi:hypothetical protein HK097_003064 [Rhizophlyctis rosea]|uniref:Uncharacterized protein n=1 Tax=Rhizophlyctis rosea TaxID=64517 RepID=A0AAD5X939_9FUNG|nr:hypothetical protein HK097_003064 [Rhizophlyctis rosea]